MDHMCQWWANRNPLAGYRMGRFPTRHGPSSPHPQTGGRRSPFQISANRLALVDNVNRAHWHFRIHWLIVIWCNQSTIVHLWPEPQTQIEHNMCRSRIPLWWWPCLKIFVVKNLTWIADVDLRGCKLSTAKWRFPKSDQLVSIMLSFSWD